MSAGFFDETVNAFITRTPFQPFTVVLVNGNRFEVDHPRALAYRGGGRALYLAPGAIPVIFDNEGVSEIVGDVKEHAGGVSVSLTSCTSPQQTPASLPGRDSAGR